MDISDISLDLMRTFIRVVERASLSAVARDTGTGQSTVSRQIQMLEKAVGIPLLSRTTRRISVTDEGRRYYEQCLKILALVEQASDEARSSGKDPKGIVRLSCTSAFGVLHINRMLFEFQDRYPHITVELQLTDQRINLVEEGVDLAVRLGPLADSSLILKPLGLSHRILVASSGYLDRHPAPETPQQLASHECIRMLNIDGGHQLELRGAEVGISTVPFDGTFRTDHGLSAREAVLAGRGIAAAHHWLVEDCLRNGQLKILLPMYTLKAVPMNILVVPERAKLQRVRLLLDFLSEQISSHLRNCQGYAHAPVFQQEPRSR